MSSIGIFTFIRMDGEELAAGSIQVIQHSRPGIAGVVFDFRAAKAPMIQKVTREGVANAAVSNAADEDYKALKGSLVTVVDDHGRTNLSVMVVDVKVIRKQPMLLDVPNNHGYHVEAEWMLQSTI